MRQHFLLFVLVLTLLLLLTTSNCAFDGAQAQNLDNHSLQIQGITWSQTTLNILLVTPTGQSWWNPAYVNPALRAIGQWNDAISYFAANYSSYAYLSNLRLEASVSNETKPGYNIYINWTQYTLENTSDVIGLTTPIANQDNIIVNCTISLVTHGSHDLSISDGDMQNVALHELGHSLGLGHSNYTGDVMYPAFTLLGPAKFISTLDVYGVATVFGWIQNVSTLQSVSHWLTGNPVTLPQNIHTITCQCLRKTLDPKRSLTILLFKPSF